MKDAPASPAPVRFGVFEWGRQRRKHRKQSLKVRPLEKRFQILQISCGTVGKHGHILAFTLWTILSLLCLARPLLAQTTVGTGSIVGTVSDPSGAVVSGADVTVTNLATGQIIRLTTNSSGAFNSGALIPGDYKTRISSKLRMAKSSRRIASIRPCASWCGHRSRISAKCCCVSAGCRARWRRACPLRSVRRQRPPLRNASRMSGRVAAMAATPRASGAT